MDAKVLNEMRIILNKHDPIGIYFGKKINFDEYDSEINEIYKAFQISKNLVAFIENVHKIFKKWFTPEIAGNKKRYVTLSNELFNHLSQSSCSKEILLRKDKVLYS